MVSFSQVEEAIAAICAGEMVIVVDDKDRENEGDLILAAEKATAKQIAFMIRHTSGIICAPMMHEDAARLQLDPMVSKNDAPLGTAFTVSVDVKAGLTTGISAEERCNTLKALACSESKIKEFVRPGHVFPLIAKRGGLLMRSGHTEAAVDLAQMAGLAPVGVISELVNDNGTVKRGADISEFASAHRLKVVSIAELIRYRQSREKLIEQSRSFSISTSIGEAKVHAFTTPFDQVEHFALVFGTLDTDTPVLTRLHAANILEDVFSDGGLLARIYKRFQENGGGVLIYLREGATGVPLSQNHPSQNSASDIQTDSDQTRQQQWRDVGLGAQILRALEIRTIRVLTSQSRHYVGLDGFGLEITKTEILE